MKRFFTICIISLLLLPQLFSNTPRIDSQMKAFERILTRIYMQEPVRFSKIEAKVDELLSNEDIQTSPNYDILVALDSFMEALREKAEGREMDYELLEVVDGDTVRLNVFMEGDFIEEKSFRLIGIDAPENSSLRFGYAEQLGNEATEFLREQTNGKVVSAGYDESQGVEDKYGRGLIYLFADGVNINELMIKNGFAREYTYDEVYMYQEDFLRAEEQAQNNNLGIWALKEIEEISSLNFDTQNSGECTIKGNINSDGEKIYHIPGCQSYSQTRINTSAGEQFFCSEDDAIRAGWRIAMNCN